MKRILLILSILCYFCATAYGSASSAQAEIDRFCTEQADLHIANEARATEAAASEKWWEALTRSKLT